MSVRKRPVDPAHLHPLLGTILDGCYRVDAWMADGGMATVYRGTQLLLDRPVAIKALHDDLDASSDAARRFVREVALARGLSHPNIVRVYDGGLTEDGQLYLVMECLRGRNLADYVPREGLEPGLAAALFVQLCDGVEAIHTAGLIHRDLKPSNVFVNETRWGLNVKVLDFGLAREASSRAENSLLTQDAVLGTAGYLAPEQIDLHAEPDHRADVYALGALLAFMVLGDNPFRARTMIASIQRQLEGPTPELLARIPVASLRPIIAAALAAKPRERIASVAALREAVLAAEIPGPSASGSTGVPRPGRPREADYATDVIPLSEAVDPRGVIARYPAPLRQIASSILDVLRTADGPLTSAEIRDRTRYECELDLDAYTRVLAALAEDQLVIAGVSSWRAV